MIPQEKVDDIILLHCYEEEASERPIDVALIYSEEVSEEAPFARVVEFQPMRSRWRELTRPVKNSQNWLNVKVINAANSEQCRQVILERIKFEIEHFKVLRLDDHIETMIISLDIADNQLLINSNTKMLLSDIAALDLSQVVLTQITLEHIDTLAFCQEHQLTTLLDLSPHEFVEAIEYTYEHVEFTKVVSFAKQKQQQTGYNLSRVAFESNEDAFTQMESQVNLSLSRLEIFVKNIDLLPIDQQAILCQYILKDKDSLQYGECFTSSFKNTPSMVEQLCKIAEEKLKAIILQDTKIGNENRLSDKDQLPGGNSEILGKKH